MCPPLVSCASLEPPAGGATGVPCDDEVWVDCLADVDSDVPEGDSEDCGGDEDVNPTTAPVVSVTDCVTSDVFVAVDTTVLFEVPEKTVVVVVLPLVDGSEPELGPRSRLGGISLSDTSVLRRIKNVALVLLWSSLTCKLCGPAEQGLALPAFR